MPDPRSRVANLGKIARVLSRESTLTRRLEVAADEARQAMHAASVSISRLEPGTGTLRTLVNVGKLGPRELRWPENEIYVVHDFNNYDPDRDALRTWAHDLEGPHCDPHQAELLTELGKTASLAAPIIVDGQAWGEFYATRHQDGAPLDDPLNLAYLEVFVAILGGAISRSLQEDSLEQLAFRDPLTSLMNRRGLDRQTAQAFDVPPGISRIVTIVMVDINGLKQVNDTQGHVAGDRLIQSTAQSLVKTFGRLAGSLVARIGGDEFTVLVSGQDPWLVVSATDSLCARPGHLAGRPGLSAGAATAELTATTELRPGELLAAADRAQYLAKHAQLTRTAICDTFKPPTRPS